MHFPSEKSRQHFEAVRRFPFAFPCSEAIFLREKPGANGIGTAGESDLLSRYHIRRRRLRAFLTVIILLLLQIFNEMDWNCSCHSHHRCCDANCRAEHRTETICQQDMSNLLEAAWTQIQMPSIPFPLFSLWEESARLADIPHQLLRLPVRSHAPPPEEPVPQRC